MPVYADMRSESANEAVRLRMGSTALLPPIGENGVCGGLCIVLPRPLWGRLWWLPFEEGASMPDVGAVLPTLSALEESGVVFRVSEARLLVMPPIPGAPRLGDWRLGLTPALLPNTLLVGRPLGSVGDRRPSRPGCCGYVAPMGGWGEP